MTTPRHGFTRLDLLVASVLVVLSMGMLLPAAQEVKEAENRKRCVNHLKQLGVAAANYDSNYNCLPPGWLGPFVNEKPPMYEHVQNLSVLAFLLPYLEEDKVYRELQTRAPADFFNIQAQRPAWFLNAGLTKAGSARIGRFRCPSAPDMFQAAEGILVAVHFAHDARGPVAPAFHSLPVKEPAFEKLGRTNYFAVAGMWGRGTNLKLLGTERGMVQYEGLFSNRSQRSITQAAVADGTSQTLLFGEGTGGSHDWQADPPKETKPVQYAASWMGCGALPTGGGLATHGEPSYWYQFSSAHEGSIVNFCFADGAVRALRTAKSGTRFLPTPKLPDEATAERTSPYWVLQQLAGYRDGKARPTDGILVKDKDKP